MKQYEKIPKAAKIKSFFASACHNYYIAMTYDIMVSLRLGGVSNELELEGSQWNAVN